MDIHKHPLMSFGVDFVVLPFDLCIDTKPFARGFKLFVQIDRGLLWVTLASVLQLMLVFSLLYKVFFGSCNGYLCIINLLYFLPLSAIMYHVVELFFFYSTCRFSSSVCLYWFIFIPLLTLFYLGLFGVRSF